jgi:hypothetical protein
MATTPKRSESPTPNPPPQLEPEVDYLHEVGPAGAIIRGGAALTRIENDTIAQMAITRPRNPAKVLQACLKELELMDPKRAEKLWYKIPYKDDGAEGGQSMVQGINIRAANIMVRQWGNCSASCREVERNEDGTTLEGVFIDFETMTRIQGIRVASWYRKLKGKNQVVRLRADEFANAVIIAGQKAKRNAILDGLPDYLKEAFWNKARAIAAGNVARPEGKKISPAEVAKRIVDAFLPYQVSRADLEKKLGHELEKCKPEEWADLKGMLNALEQREVSANDLFPPEEEPGVTTPEREPGEEAEGEEESPLFGK